MTYSSSKARTVIYTGAPISSSLSWSESHLTAPLQPAYSPNKSPSLPSAKDQNATPQYPLWRSLPILRTHLPTGLTQATNPDFQPYHPEPNEEGTGSFLSTTDISFVSDSVDGTSFISKAATDGKLETADEILSQYYEHSFALHEELPSSHVLPADSFQSTSTSHTSSSTSFPFTVHENDTIDYSISTPSQQTHLKTLLSTPLTHLSAIPTASYLHSIEPQTMTVNLLLGIIAMPPPRTIITRRDARTISLLELTVGDETKAGFGINIWLPAPFSYLKPGEVDLREEVERLRVRDVVLMRNVALTSFRGRVYGQSLRRGMTRVELVYRFGGQGEEAERGVLAGMERELDGEGGGVVLEKVRRVREWVLGFVGGGDRRKGGKGEKGVQLPPDTQ